MNYASIGSISSATLLTRDLAETFLFELNRLASRDDDAERKSQTLAKLVGVQQLLDAEQTDEAQLESFVNETACELFDSYCAPFTRFGTHEGDGADFGIWPDISSLEEAARHEDDVIKVAAGDEWPQLDGSVNYIMEVNDHGNVSLYEASTRRELWACV